MYFGFAPTGPFRAGYAALTPMLDAGKNKT
jgi:hypothetical protein